jgi:hypothetical protein
VAGAMINAIAKMTLGKRRVMATNIATRYTFIGNSSFCPRISLIPLSDST